MVWVDRKLEHKSSNFHTCPGCGGPCGGPPGYPEYPWGDGYLYPPGPGGPAI